MKRIGLIVSVLLVFITTAFGQGTKTEPVAGTTFTYKALVTDPESDNPVSWYVSTDAAGTTKAVHGVDYTFVNITGGAFNASNNALEGTAVYTVDIEWGAGLAIGEVLYVFIVVEDATTRCKNTMGLPIEIASEFNAMVVNVTSSDNPGTVDPDDAGNDIETETCPWDPRDPIWNGVDGHTDIGYSEVVFRIERQYSNNQWQFEYAISERNGQAFTIEGIRFVDDANVVLSTTTNPTGTLVVADTEDYVLAYVRITNQVGVTLNIDFDLLTGDDHTKDLTNGDLDSISDDNNAGHTILSMPVIEGFN